MTKLPRLDWRSLVGNPTYWLNNIARRQVKCDHEMIVKAYNEYKRLEHQRQLLSTQRNTVSQSTNGPSEEARHLRQEIVDLSDRLDDLSRHLSDLTATLPNDTHPDVPCDEDRVIDQFPAHHHNNATACDHIEAMRTAGWMNNEEAIKVAGRGVSVLRGTAALVEHALCNYAINFAIKHGHQLVTVPDLVNESVVESAGFAPRRHHTDTNAGDDDDDNLTGAGGGSDPVYRLPEGLALAGTAELPLLAMHANARFSPTDLPILLVARGHAFRREAGQYGATSRGLYRLHQFTKVELFAISHPDHSEQVFERLCQVQLDLIRSLGFAGRRLEMCTPELGSSAYRKRDIELWFPAMQRFGEVTSASNCTDYQARRADIRMSGPDKRFVHTLNATAVAVPRLIQCMAEHGCVVPTVLKPFMDQLTA